MSEADQATIIASLIVLVATLGGLVIGGAIATGGGPLHGLAVAGIHAKFKKRVSSFIHFLKARCNFIDGREGSEVADNLVRESDVAQDIIIERRHYFSPGAARLYSFGQDIEVGLPVRHRRIISELTQVSSILILLRNLLRSQRIASSCGSSSKSGKHRDQRDNPFHKKTSGNGSVWCCYRYPRYRRAARRPFGMRE